jgi:hypothetical protein
MRNNYYANKSRVRVLAIDPTIPGFGYVVFEGPERLIDWGVPYFRGEKHARCLKRIDRLITQYDPDVAVLEDVSSQGCRRGRRVRKLVRAARALFARRRVRIKLVPRTTMCQVFAGVGCANKDDIAAHLGTRYPELGPRVPPRRKCWMAEDWRLGMFDAAAFAHAYFDAKKQDVTLATEREAA